MAEIDDWCGVHGYEPINGTAYLICGECMHAFMTAEELIGADAAVRAELGIGGVAERAEDITVCPHCTHSF